MLEGMTIVTEKLYWKDAYLHSFEARVIEVRDNVLYFDRTAFNPAGGGLPGDTGMAGNVKIKDTVKQGEDTVAHMADGQSIMTAGETVKCEIDWDRRYKIMRMHTAAHALSAVMQRETGALITGNQIRPEESRIDFNLENFDRGRIEELVSTVNSEIAAGREVRSYFLPKEEALRIPGIVKLAGAFPPDVSELRIVEIDGLDIQADGGVHVRNTSEIGRIRIVKTENKGKNNRRIYFALD
ncbi:MAG: alanyl-tRNA editing protein [Methanomassiliicoccales archaeon]